MARICRWAIICWPSLWPSALPRRPRRRVPKPSSPPACPSASRIILAAAQVAWQFPPSSFRAVLARFAGRLVAAWPDEHRHFKRPWRQCAGDSRGHAGDQTRARTRDTLLLPLENCPAVDGGPAWAGAGSPFRPWGGAVAVADQGPSRRYRAAGGDPAGRRQGLSLACRSPISGP